MTKKSSTRIARDKQGSPPSLWLYQTNTTGRKLAMSEHTNVKDGVTAWVLAVEYAKVQWEETNPSELAPVNVGIILMPDVELLILWDRDRGIMPGPLLRETLIKGDAVEVMDIVNALTGAKT